MVTSPLVVTLVFFCHICLTLVSAANNITTNEFLGDSDTLVSSNGRFMFGFFSPLNSTNRYVGIWYNTEGFDTKVVWVANRNNPINGSSGVLKISVDGNLQLSDGKELIYWSSNISHQANSTAIAQLQDTGNLVLLSSAIGKIVWQSFEHLTNSMLPHTTVSIDLSIVRNLDEDVYPVLRSWKSASDPSTGRFTLSMVPFQITEFIIIYDDEIYWRSGPWNGSQFLGLPDVSAETAVSFRTVYDSRNRTLDLFYSEVDETVLRYYALNDDGNLVLNNWDEDSQKWELLWRSIDTDCDTYGKCGPFGSCNSEGSPICSCLLGFEPKNIDEWMEGNWTSGCVRRTPLLCGITGRKEDKFLELKHMKAPFDPTYELGYNQDACRSKCLESCSCVAYAHSIGIGCMIWETLMDIQVFTADNSANLFIRLAHSELDETQETSTMKIIIPVIATIAATTFVVIAYCLWSWMYRRNVKKSKNNETQFVDAGVDQADFKDLSLYKLKELEVATDSFSESKKLGQGGFGPVYMGILENGVKVAVKRLSRASGQGLQEFMNEVLVISKLQHKNLVRLLGCCVDREEKLLVYEFMPNKSLDALLFDSHHQKQLDWKKRFNIINGICRGLLYLHRDSRLKIIHRDLKASNILLDEELDPKISDFGMARIFGSKQDQANTLRVVGTYGYMSPEYAMEGLFSEKSDVFSLGVLLLEIVSGRKNSSFQNNESLSLLTYAWKLWTENETLSLVDPAIRDPCFRDEFLKCIQLGLLCVQEYPEDRPTISALISMLDVQDIADLPHPTQPGFTHRKAASSDEVLQGHQEHGSVNHVSLTAFSGR